MKKILSLVAVLALSMTAMAQDNVKMSAAANAETKTISISMTNDFVVEGIGYKFQLPEGVTLGTVYDEDEEEDVPAVLKNTDRCKTKHTVSCLPCKKDGAVIEGAYSVNVYGASFKGTEGEILTMTLQGDMKGTVKFYAIAFTNADAKSFKQDDFEIALSTDADVDDADNIVFFDNTEVFSGTTTSVPLYMNNKDEITGVQFDMTLPTGITLDGKVTVNTTDGRATSVSHSVTSSLNNGKVRVICYSMSSVAFSGESGAIFNIPLKVDESLAEGTYNVKFDDIVLSETDGKTKHTVKSSVSQLEVVPGNVLHFDKSEAFLGLTTSVPLYLNKDDISSVQFDMTLPIGVTLDGNVTVNTTDGRATSDSHEVQTSVLSDGKVRVKCCSAKSIAFEGKSGAILDIPLKVDESVNVGTYNVEFSDITMTKTSGFNHIVKSFVSELAVSNVPNDPSLFDNIVFFNKGNVYPGLTTSCLLYTSPSPRDS